jgi:[acyl-carrier-protein] S-malonyltransferase
MMDRLMTKKIALLFAGQGAQTVGMGQDLFESHPAAREVIERADAILGRSLSQVMFAGPVEELTRTANCQPALFVHGLACLAALQSEQPFEFHGAAGLSLGEFTAHAAAETFDFETGLRLVENRGRYMDEACEATSGAMAAMIGADENTVRDLAAECEIDVANLNCPGQIVLSGEATKIAMVVGIAKEKGVRIAKTLNVAGAYHSRLMDSAYRKLLVDLQAVQFRTPKVPVICNVDGVPAVEPEEIRRTLGDQVTGTVRWTSCVEYLLDDVGCDLFIELGPGGVLSGLVQRIRKGTEVLSVWNSASVADAAQRLKAL